MTRNLSYYFFLMLFNVCKLKSKTEQNFTIIISQGKKCHPNNTQYSKKG